MIACAWVVENRCSVFRHSSYLGNTIRGYTTRVNLLVSPPTPSPGYLMVSNNPGY
jgi:hypothetical protein